VPAPRSAGGTAAPALPNEIDQRAPPERACTRWGYREDPGVVLGRKNHYGSRSERGTEVAAPFYRLIESAKLAGVEPDGYPRAAARDAIRGERIARPHELATV
jgi:hypothetical protein